MTILILLSLTARPGSELPPMANAADHMFAFGSLFLLVTLIAWSSWNTPDPPQE